MSYIVLARKWRPQSFDEIIGQDYIVRTLKNAISSGHLHHAFIFAGPRGVGKTSLARIFAKSLNCKDGPTIKPCNKCSSCSQITEGRSLDVIEIDGASNTGVDNIRELRESVKFATTTGRFKVYIIDEVHMLSDAAFNALLKTLEEPPEHVKFVFATTQPQKILPTILSRCQRFDFGRIPALKIIEKLQMISKKEKLNIDKDILFAVAKASDGSMRDAESILDQLLLYSRDKINLSDVSDILGTVEQEILFKITDRIIERDTNGAINLIDELIDKGKDLSHLLIELIQHMRNLMIVKISPGINEKLIDLPREVKENLLKQSKRLSNEKILLIFDILINAQETSKRLNSLRTPLEMAMAKLTIAGNRENPQVKVNNNPNPHNDSHKKEHNPANPKQNQQHIALSRVEEIWGDLLKRLSNVKMSVATFLREGKPLRIENNYVLLGFNPSSNFHKEVLERKENRQLIEDLISEMLSANLKVLLITTDEVEHREIKEEIEEVDQKQHKDDPMIKAALDTFGGKVIDNTQK